MMRLRGEGTLSHANRVGNNYTIGRTRILSRSVIVDVVPTVAPDATGKVAQVNTPSFGPNGRAVSVDQGLVPRSRIGPHMQFADDIIKGDENVVMRFNQAIKLFVLTFT